MRLSSCAKGDVLESQVGDPDDAGACHASSSDAENFGPKDTKDQDTSKLPTLSSGEISNL